MSSFPELVNPFSLDSGDGYFWLKGNLHTHTTCSDGKVEPQQRVDDYAAAGYDFLALTDHNRITPVTSVKAPQGLTLIQGVELHPDNAFGGQRHHLLALNVSEDMDARSMPAQHVIDAVKSQGGSIWLAHPYWSAVNILRDAMPLKGLAGIEVYNTACRVSGRGESSVHWDDWMNLTGEMIPAIANDDAHKFADDPMTDVCQSWTMVRVRERTPKAIVEALERGAAYSSTGPVIHEVKLSPSKRKESGNMFVTAHVRCSPCQRISVICNDYGVEYHRQGELFEEAVFDIYKNALHARLEFIGADGSKAWTNPFDLRAYYNV